MKCSAVGQYYDIKANDFPVDTVYYICVLQMLNIINNSNNVEQFIWPYNKKVQLNKYKNYY